MKKTKVAALLLATAICISGCGSKSTGNSIRESKAKYMTINGKEVTHQDFFKQFDFYSKVVALGNNLATKIQETFVKDTYFKGLISEKKYEISEEEYKAAIDKAIESIGGVENYKNYLEFIDATEEVFEENIKMTLRETKYFEWYAKENAPTIEKIKEVYAQNPDRYDSLKAKHILVSDEEKAKEVYEKLKSGGDFVKLSDEYSKDEHSKKRGGDIGKITKQSPIAKEFLEVAFKLKEGEYSQPVKTQFGWHIISVSDVKIGAEANREIIEKELISVSSAQTLKEELGKIKVEVFDKNGKSLNSK